MVINMSNEEAQEERRRMNDERIKILKSHVVQLMEHFSSVRIICSSYDEQTKNTGMISRGDGDFYSQLGVVKDWIIEQDEKSKIWVRQRSEPD